MRATVLHLKRSMNQKSKYINIQMPNTSVYVKEIEKCDKLEKKKPKIN